MTTAVSYRNLALEEDFTNHRNNAIKLYQKSYKFATEFLGNNFYLTL